MEIKVEATGFMTRYLEAPQSFPSAEWEGKPAGELLEQLPIPKAVTCIIMINGERQNKDTPLKAGDQVKLVPLLVGG